MITTIGSSAGDAVTGERIFPGERVVDTGIGNYPQPYMNETLTRFVKEATIVWLAEQAGYSLVKCDEGSVGDSEVVDGADVIVGDGAASVGKVKAGGRKSVK